MSQSEDVPKTHNSNSDWFYFDQPPDRDRPPDLTQISDLDQLIPNVTKFVSMTKFDGPGAARRWLHVLDEELVGQLSPNTWA